MAVDKIETRDFISDIAISRGPKQDQRTRPLNFSFKDAAMTQIVPLPRLYSTSFATCLLSFNAPLPLSRLKPSLKVFSKRFLCLITLGNGEWLSVIGLSENFINSFDNSSFFIEIVGLFSSSTQCARTNISSCRDIFYSRSHLLSNFQGLHLRLSYRNPRFQRFS